MKRATRLAIVFVTTSCASAPAEVAPRRDRAEAARIASARQSERPAELERRRGPPDPEAPRLERLARAVGARRVPVEGAVRLGRFFTALDRLDARLQALEEHDERIAALERAIRAGQDRDANTLAKQDSFRRRAALERGARALSVRVLHLGDSHIAADYITRVARARLQARFGDGGRGFVAAEQRAEYGGRRLARRGWRRTRLADADGPGLPLGVAGVRLRSTRPGAELVYRLEPEDREVHALFVAHPESPGVRVWADADALGSFSTRGASGRLERARVDVDLPPPRPERLRLRAEGAGAELLGLSFETARAGVLYDAVGPVGADARAWLSVEPTSFARGLELLRPQLVVIMLGGNDALALRQGRRRPAEVAAELRRLTQRARDGAPEADCLLFGPMDAATRDRRGRLRTRDYVLEVVRMQRAIARDEGCAFWDAFAAMGGEGSFGRWLDAGLMNEDLVHPRSGGGDLLGHLFARALDEAYLGG